MLAGRFFSKLLLFAGLTSAAFGSVSTCDLNNLAATCMPTGVATVGGVTFDLPFIQAGPTLFMGGGDADFGRFRLSGTILGDPDPFLVYGLGFTNNTASDLPFDVTLSIPYVLGPYNQAISSHSSSITDGNGNGNAYVALQAGTTAVHNPNYDGIAFGAITGTCNVNGAASFSAACDPGTTTTHVINTAASGTLAVRLVGLISPGDSYSLNGIVFIDASTTSTIIPEPGTYALFGLAGVVLVGVARRRKATV